MDSTLDEQLLAAAAAASGTSISALGELARTSLEYDAFMEHREVHRIRGGTLAGGIPWSMIEKRTEGPLLASAYLYANGARELQAYRSGLLVEISDRVRAPRMYGSHVDPAGGLTLWLEDLVDEAPRPLDAQSILDAANDLGHLSGGWLGRSPSESWLFTGWIDRHSQPEAVARGLATIHGAHPDTAARFGARLSDADRLIRRQSDLRVILRSLPQTLCHHDAVGANVFRTHGQTVLIDWESIGPGTVGADLASLLVSSVRRGDVAASTMTGVLEEAVHTYAAAVREEATDVRIGDVERGFHASVALRWKLAADLVAAADGRTTPRRGSLPNEEPEEATSELMRLFDVILASAARVLG